MAEVIFIARRCRRCDGIGLVSNQVGGNLNGSCDRCNGTGITSWDSIDLSNLEAKLNDILDKCDDIFEKLNE